jgi:hypothetical protein
MRRLCSFLAVALLSSGSAQAQISNEIKAACLKAADFVGCVKVMSGGVAAEMSGVDKLRETMKQVASRLENGVSYNSSTDAFRPLVDQLAIVKEQNPGELAVKVSLRAESLFNVLQSYWYNSIKYEGIALGANPEINKFNLIVGSEVISPLKTYNRFGSEMVNDTDQKVARAMMYNFVIGILKEGSVSKATIEEYDKRREKLIKDAMQEAWKSYLKKNPALQAWVKANPGPAAKKRQEYNSQNPVKEVQLPTYAQTQSYLDKFNPGVF